MDVEVSPGPANEDFSTYRMRNQTQANTGSNTRNMLLIWLDPQMHWHGSANDRPGRSPTFSDNAVQFCLAIKGLLDIPLRQATQLTKKLFQIVSLNWLVPDSSTACRRRKQLREVVVDIREPQGLHLLVRDSGIEIMSIGDWEIRNKTKNCHTGWVKVQLVEQS